MKRKPLRLGWLRPAGQYRHPRHCGDPEQQQHHPRPATTAARLGLDPGSELLAGIEQPLGEHVLSAAPGVTGTFGDLGGAVGQLLGKLFPGALSLLAGLGGTRAHGLHAAIHSGGGLLAIPCIGLHLVHIFAFLFAPVWSALVADDVV